ncbi:MAG: LysM peptidoglycan-binding domain-containing protein [Acidobacteria bacterium]|nr:LysM peptidoglycan-binding domain-containing protein [Acidobacteriota bacterium]MCA1610205.1 LysM peptidoglycan-binding domain-containing protein [Acidobacteriota bacterium]
MADDPNKPDFSDVVSESSSTAASPSGASAEKGSGTSRTYVVQGGDSLSKISKRFYGDANSWKRIFEANKDIVKNPDMIQPGWKLRIPE